MNKIYLVFIILCYQLTPVSAQDDQFAAIVIETTEVANGIYMLVGQGGNIGASIGEDGVFLIDDQFAPLTEKIRNALSELTLQPIKFMINTHWHFDHTGGNENLGNQGVILVAHDNVRKRMSTEGFIEAFNQTIPAAPEVALPSITFSETATFHLNGQTIEAIHVLNAHTDGDSIIFFREANVIHTGDIFFNGLYPFIDKSSAGSVDGVLRAVDLVLSLANNNTRIIPGHGPLANKRDLTNYRRMLMTVRNRMQDLIDEEMTIEEIIELNPNADFDQVWGQGFLNPETFLRILHSLMQP
jgi:glyoxylase-like metal-dependent hydrolase (beta-lactamase superfamily II)